MRRLWKLQKSGSMSDLTISQFAQRVAGETQRRLLEGDAFTVVDEDELPDDSTP